MWWHTFDTSSWETKAGGSRWISGEPGYTVRYCLKTKTKQWQWKTFNVDAIHGDNNANPEATGY